MRIILVTVLLLANQIIDLTAAELLLELPELNSAEAWGSAGPQAGDLQVSTSGDALEIHFDAAPGSTADLLLNDPIPIPNEADDLSFQLSGQLEANELGLDVILEDVAGVRWYARTKLPGANEYHGALGLVNTGQLKGRTARLAVPAFSQPSNPRFFRTGGGPGPERPWKWVGLRFLGDRKPHHQEQPVALYLRNFIISEKAARSSAYSGISAEVTGKPTAYAGRRVEFCEELDGRPGVSLADVYVGFGRYEVGWDVFDNFAGKPIGGGFGEFDCSNAAGSIPLPLQLGNRISFPRLAPGTYWVRWRAHYFAANSNDSRVPSSVIEGQERLYIHQSESIGELESVAPRPGWLEVSPLGNSFVAEVPGEFGLDVSAPTSSAEGSAWQLRYEVITPHLRTKRLEGVLELEESGDGSGRTKIDLSEVGPGAFYVNLALLEDGRVLDQMRILTGLKSGLKATKPLEKLPSGVLDWQAALTRKEPYFHLSPMWHSATWGMTDRTRWDWFDNFLSQAAAVSRDIEYVTPWSILEPLPGVYDWEEMDRFLARSEELGLQVLVWPGFWGEEPAWLPSVPTQAEDGRIFFDFVYDFYGVRQDYANSTELQGALLNALRAVVGHTREHPAVQGYFLIQELPADAPFMNWMSGFGALEREGYRQAIRNRFPDLDSLSERWGREVASFEGIEPPDQRASDREWLDWLEVRGGSYDTFMRRLLETVRELDPLRPVFVYGDLFGITLKSSEFPERGFAKANGGSHDAIHPFSISQIGLGGVLQRTEDHWPGKWTGYFPEVLDASVFAMSYGGGLAMNCKHYMFTYMPELGKDHLLTFDDLREPPYSLDRFEKFMPIWSAMRPAERMPLEILALLDTEAGLLTNKALNRNGLWDGEAQMACYRAQINFAADEFPGAGEAKLLLMIKSHLGTLTRERIEQIKNYVANGGTLLVLPEAGRNCVEEPGDDWVLMRELGFSAPGELVRDESLAKPVDGQEFAPGLEAFSVRRVWPHELSEGESVVAVSARAGLPVLTWRPFGKGRVVVAWTEKLVPRGVDGANGNVLKSVSLGLGIEEVMAADNPALWMNMLHDAGTGRYFGLAHAGQFGGRPTVMAKGAVRFRLPEGTNYEVVELITGRNLGILSSSQIWDEGISVELNPRQVAIFQFSPARDK